MCGIFSYIGPRQNAGEIILEGLKALEYRGYDSWGIAVGKNDSSLVIEKNVGKIADTKILKSSIVNHQSSVGIGHTRWATHGGVTKENSHPHSDCNEEIVIVHNGIIENYTKLKQKLKLNHVYKSETDSEVFSHYIEEKLKEDSNLLSVVMSAFKEVEGLNAIIVYRPSTEEFIAVKNGSPLIFGIGEKEYFLASDSAALLPHTQKVYYLEDNECLHITRENYTLYDISGTEKSLKPFILPLNAESGTLGDYPNYMMKEMYEQPPVIRNLVREQTTQINKAAAQIKNAFGTYFIACGTAYYAALAGTYLFSKIAKHHTNASAGSEFGYLTDFLTDKSLVVALSQSGETIDIISSLKTAKTKKSKILAITNTLGSTLYRMSDSQLMLNAGPEKCVLSTKSFTAKITYLFLLAHALNNTLEAGQKDIEKAVKQIEHLLKEKESLHAIAKQIKNKNHVYILGRGLSYPTALESALKIKEVSYIHAEGFAGGELKHGVMALIEKGTPVLVYNPSDETYEDTLSSAHEVKARGAYVIGVADKPNEVYDTFIPVQNCGDATIIPNVVVAQLLGYYLATELGNDVDKPRNLAKSVTVK
jgi:glucosamine--fructose-6-phosphate aminotransferase (isomerizing)